MKIYLTTSIHHKHGMYVFDAYFNEINANEWVSKIESLIEKKDKELLAENLTPYIHDKKLQDFIRKHPDCDGDFCGDRNIRTQYYIIEVNINDYTEVFADDSKVYAQIVNASGDIYLAETGESDIKKKLFLKWYFGQFFDEDKFDKAQ